MNTVATPAVNRFQDKPQKNIQDKMDKVANFNKIAPLIFGARLQQLGYEFDKLLIHRIMDFFVQPIICIITET